MKPAHARFYSLSRSSSHLMADQCRRTQAQTPCLNSKNFWKPIPYPISSNCLILLPSLPCRCYTQEQSLKTPCMQIFISELFPGELYLRQWGFCLCNQRSPNWYTTLQGPTQMPPLPKNLHQQLCFFLSSRNLLTWTFIENYPFLLHHSWWAVCLSVSSWKIVSSQSSLCLPAPWPLYT